MCDYRYASGMGIQNLIFAATFLLLELVAEVSEERRAAQKV